MPTAWLTTPTPLFRRSLARAGSCALGLAVIAAAGALAAGEASVSVAKPGIAAVRAQLETQRGREQALAGHVAAFSGLVNRLGSDIAVLQQREGLLEGSLSRQQSALDRTQTVLRRERAHLAALRARLVYSRAVLSRRLVEMYTAGRPDLVSVVITSRGWVDLLERGEFLRRINQQDAVVIHSVRAARNSVAISAARLGQLEARQQQIADAILFQRNQAVATRSALDRKRSGLVRARDDARATLDLVSASRGRLQSRLGALEAEQSRLETQNADAGSVSTGGWAIPWNIVNCESGGRNTGPNYIGASGYYQIIPSTWQGAGGKGPAAYLAPKSEQDRIAAQLYNHGAGASNWVCAGR